MVQYRPFGSTGEKISALGFGAMRLPMYKKGEEQHVDEEKAIPMLRRAVELGVNYFDTAYPYCNGESEIVVGKALRDVRDKVLVSTKMPTWLVKEKSDYRRFLEEQLKKLDMDYIDFYHFHGLNKQRWEETVLKLDLLEEAQKAKDEGLIKHISFSFHDKPEVLKELVDTGAFETLLCQYNLLDRSNEEAIAHAHQKGLGTVVMGPVGGGRLAGLPADARKGLATPIKSSAELALRFVFANQNVDCALSGMSTMEQLEENAQIAASRAALSPEDLQAVNEMMEENKRLADLYCTGCGYCVPCPQEIKIPDIFRIMNYHRVYGLTEYARTQYARLEVKADACVECGKCEEKCPQNIEIRKQLKETHAALA